jgi:hypothetical protein
MEFVSSSFIDTFINVDINLYIMYVIMFLIILISFLFKNLKTYDLPYLTINFPYVLHLIFLFIDFIFTLYITQGGTNVEDVRATISEFQIPRPLKLITVCFYITTLLLFGKLSLLSATEDKSNVGKNSKWLLWIVFGITLLYSIYKDVNLGSRGSIVNLTAFALAGWTYVQPITFRSFGKAWGWLLIIIILTFGLLFLLTLNRSATNVIEMSVLWDSLFYRFASNILVLYNFLAETLYYRTGIAGEYTSDWINMGQRGSYSQYSLLHFFPTIGTLINRYVLLDNEYQTVTTYFDIYGDYPYNAYNFILPLLLSGPLGIFMFVLYFFFLRSCAKKAPYMNFFIYGLIVYFSFMAFTSFAVIEIPFILIPIFAYFFRRCFTISKKVDGETLSASNK